MQSNPEKELIPATTPVRGFLSMVLFIWRRIENIVFGFVFVFIVLYFILQSPPFQNWLVGKITTKLSNELHTTVHLDHVDIALFDNLVLEGLYIADQKGDTLLYARELRAGLRSNVFTALYNKLEFDEIRINRAKFHLLHRVGEQANNIQFLLDYFSAPIPQESQPKPFYLAIKNLWLTNIEVLNEDSIRGERMRFWLGQFNVRVKSWDTGANLMKIQTASIDGINFQYARFDGHPLPEKPLAKPLKVSEANKAANASTSKGPLQVLIERFNLENGKFKYDASLTDEALPTENIMNFKHLNVSEIALQASDVHLSSDLQFAGMLEHLSAKEMSGLNLQHAYARQVIVCDTLTALYDTKIETAGTSLGDTIMLHYKRYSDYLNFNNRVQVDGRFKEGSKVRIGDIAVFSSSLANTAFFRNNKEETALLSGHIYGKVNSLNGRGLDIKLGQRTFMRGDFDGDDLAEGTDRLRIQVDFETLRSDMGTIRSIIPGFAAPQVFNKLGSINFTGRYQILFGYNHILDGRLQTDVGYGDIDMELDLTNGRERATYSGQLDMNNFDLARWTGDSDFGKSTFHINIAEGSAGLTLPTIKAKASGAIDTLYYKGYRYSNLQMDGSFSKYVFDGQFGIEDRNINFRFDGTVNLQDSMPVYDFKADVKRIDLQALNIIDKDWVVSGKIPRLNLRMRNLGDLKGEALLSDIVLLEDGKIEHKIDILQFNSGFSETGKRQFVLRSDLLDGLVEGNFNPLNLAEHLQILFTRNHPDFARQLGWALTDSLNRQFNDVVDFNLNIKSSRNWTQLFAPELDTLEDISLQGRIENARAFSFLQLNIPKLHYGAVKLDKIDLEWNSEGENLDFNILLPAIQVGSRPSGEGLSIAGSAEKDVLKLDLQTLGKDSSNFIRNVNLKGALTVVDSLWQIRFNGSNLALFNEPWYIADDNFVRFTNGYFAANNFELGNSNNQRIRLDSMNNGRGLGLVLTNFDLNFLNKVFRSRDTTMYRGKIYDFEVAVKDVFKMEDLSVFLTTDTVFIKNHPYGEMTGNFEMARLDAPLSGKVFLNTDEYQLRVAAAWLPTGDKAIDFGEFKTLRPGEFQAQVNSTNFPMRILQEFIPGISKTSGLLNIDAHLGGPFSKVEMDGEAEIDEAQFQMDYLKSMYYIKKQKITLSSTKIWASNVSIFDGSGLSEAHVNGGLRHQNFHNWQIDCNIESVGDNFMIINTLKEDNDLYYGQGMGRFKATFSGDFARTNIVVNATTSKNTRLYIPLYTVSDQKEVNFITFIDKSGKDSTKINTNSFKKENLTGLNFEMNLSITEDAEVQLIFDEQAGDIIKGRGVGDISLLINREGEFKMYGNYVIKRGEYLFTLLNLVNKPFTVASGGTINWYGDPYGAQLQLDATYDENTPVYNLISEEVNLVKDQRLGGEAQQTTRVLVTMHLTGDLFKPDISFDLDFPNLDSRVKSLVENKLRLLKQDQNEMNRQVFGLIVVGSFLPSNANSSSILLQTQSSGLNTISQVITSQLSYYLSGLAYEWFNGKVSSIDFDIAYNQYPDALNDATVGRELQVRLSSGFANDRFVVQVGSQFGLGRPTDQNQNGFIGEDVTVEIFITQNRQWRVKLYQRTEPDFAGGARRARFGGGLSYRKEFDSFDEMVKGLGKVFKK